jgi:hypothetical protein
MTMARKKHPLSPDMLTFLYRHFNIPADGVRHESRGAEICRSWCALRLCKSRDSFLVFLVERADADRHIIILMVRRARAYADWATD